VPLLRDGKTIGTFSLLRDEVSPFTDKQIELATTFADQAAIAIENVRLLDELRQRTDDLTESLAQQTATSEILASISAVCCGCSGQALPRSSCCAIGRSKWRRPTGKRRSIRSCNISGLAMIGPLVRAGIAPAPLAVSVKGRTPRCRVWQRPYDSVFLFVCSTHHRCADLALPNNVSLLFLPPYAPELNAKETFGMKSAKKSSRITPSNRSQAVYRKLEEAILTSSATPSSSSPALPFLISSGHTDLELV
jgi:GAF domain